MRWEKLGRVYVAAGEQPWAKSHAYLPTSIVLDDQRLRVYVAFLDDRQVGRIGYVDVDPTDPTRVLEVSRQPALDVGAPGMFDDSGVNPLSVFRHEGRLWLYYVGWQRATTVPYLLFTGLAFSHDGDSFQRHQRVPVLDRTDAEPMLRTGAFVQCDENSRFRAWYAVGDEWIEAGGRERPTYGIRMAVSTDGVTWPLRGVPCLAPVPPDEYGFGRPFVLDDGERLRMWYSIRSHSRGYRLGYAESDDGIAWERRDSEVGIDVSETGWDSEMIHCAWIHQAGDESYLFYNGNDYGATGFGVARSSS